MAHYLQLRTKIKPRPFANPSLFHFYSTSDSNDNKGGDQDSSNSKSSISSYLSDVKKSLNQQRPTSPPSTPLKSPTSYFSASNSLRPRPSEVSSREEIQRNLSEFRLRSSTPPPDNPNVTLSSSSKQISFQELYQRNVIGKSGESIGNAGMAPVTTGSRPSFDMIRESLQQIHFSGTSKIDKKSRDSLSISALKNSLNLKPSAPTSSGISSTLIGGTSTLPVSVFGKEMREKEGEGTAAAKSKAEFLMMYSHDQLGEKLRALRPEAKGREWFSLEELNERLIKLREMEEKNAESTVKGFSFKDLKETLKRSKKLGYEKAEKSLGE